MPRGVRTIIGSGTLDGLEAPCINDGLSARENMATGMVQSVGKIMLTCCSVMLSAGLTSQYTFKLVCILGNTFFLEP